jgi:hypothetical protein
MLNGKKKIFFGEIEKTSGDEPNAAKLGRLNGHLGSNIF